jgi:hypothetical protein
MTQPLVAGSTAHLVTKTFELDHKGFSARNSTTVPPKFTLTRFQHIPPPPPSFPDPPLRILCLVSLPSPKSSLISCIFNLVRYSPYRWVLHQRLPRLLPLLQRVFPMEHMSRLAKPLTQYKTRLQSQISISPYI